MICPGCKKKFWIKGGAIRVPTDENEMGYHEFPICKACTQEFQKIEKVQSEISVQNDKD